MGVLGARSSGKPMFFLIGFDKHTRGVFVAKGVIIIHREAFNSESLFDILFRLHYVIQMSQRLKIKSSIWFNQ